MRASTTCRFARPIASIAGRSDAAPTTTPACPNSASDSLLRLVLRQGARCACGVCLSMNPSHLSMYRYAISIEISNEAANNSGVSILFTHPLNVLLRFVWKNQAIANQGVVMSDLQEQARHKPAYDRVARFLHWLVMVLVVVQFVIGCTLPGVDGNTRPLGLIAWHLAVGTTLIVAMAVRIVWRFTHKPPPHAL